MKNKHVDVITLGCSKNLVDSELLIKQFEAGGFSVEHDSPNPKGEIVVINTCGFIGDAKEESVETILKFADARHKGRIRQLLVMGCLSERYFEQLSSEIPEVDKFYGKFNWQEVISDLGMAYRADLINERSLTTPGHYAYLKVSEGCNRTCSYCAIPIITGKHRSRSIDSLTDETIRLARKGVRELQLIAQDLSWYGLDIYHRPMLPELVDRLSKIDGIEWIRLHYTYPAGFPMKVLDIMSKNPKVCNYLDMAFQHISDHMLQMMHRKFTKAQTIELINKIREKVPGIHLRTTLITGHPGETEADFKEMMEFVAETRFERLGVFAYSHEEDTYAHRHYKDAIPDEIKQQRANAIMELQSGMSRAHNQDKIGSRIKVIIDRQENNYYIGRTEFDSPEVDPEVLVTAKQPLTTGHFYDVAITAADDYDLTGTVC